MHTSTLYFAPSPSISMTGGTYTLHVAPSPSVCMTGGIHTLYVAPSPFVSMTGGTPSSSSTSIFSLARLIQRRRRSQHLCFCSLDVPHREVQLAASVPAPPPQLGRRAAQGQPPAAAAADGQGGLLTYRRSTELELKRTEI